MLEEDTIQTRPTNFPDAADAAQASSTPHWPIGVLLCALGFVACVLLTVTPLIRLPDTVIRLHMAAGAWLAGASTWLPLTLGTLPQATSSALEFFGLILLSFLCYGCGALLVHRRAESSSQRAIRWLIWSTALLVGVIFLLTPAMLSHDILVYASYSRVLGAYHANPYFVPGSAFPNDPFTPINYWAKVVSAYGPIWVLVCGAFGWLLNPDPVTYVLTFRLLTLTIHLLNTWLVGRTLHVMGRSPRTVTLGVLLYAWNPLLLLESGLGGHNDGLMLTFVLTGVLLTASAEARAQLLRPRGYVPAVVTLTLAALVKFTALPVLAAFLLFLACKALRPNAESPRELKLALRNWRPALFALLWSGLAAALTTLVLYGPFWLGHPLNEIVSSFKNPPSALYAENSFMRSIIEWRFYHPEQAQNALLNRLSDRHLWDDLNFVAIALCLLLGTILLWRRPSTRSFLVVSLLTLCMVLLITPWFFSWYITWILGLAVLCLPERQSRLISALCALTFTFSVSALCTYLFNIGIFGAHYYLVSLFTTIPPACAFLLTLLWWKPARKQIIREKKP